MARPFLILLVAISLTSAAGAAAGAGSGAHELERQTGVASYYGSEFQGRPTASGARYDEHRMTAAHRSLPFGSRVRVTNLANDRSVIVTINDRGPFGRGRIIDVSRRAARRLGFLGAGTARVRLETLDR